jgi:hypothetical protein
LIEMHGAVGIFDVIVFELGAPVRREAIFQADAEQHARQGAGAACEGTVDVLLGECEAALRDAGLAVDERAVEGEAGAHRHVGAPPIAGEDVLGIAKGGKNTGGW